MQCDCYEKIKEKYNGIKIHKFISFFHDDNNVVEYTAGLKYITTITECNSKVKLYKHGHTKMIINSVNKPANINFVKY